MSESKQYSKDESQKRALAAKNPECMDQLPKVDDLAEPLTKQELKEAKKTCVKPQWLGFPRHRISRKDPEIRDQSIGIHSFVPSSGAKPDKDGCYGIIKLRGNFRTEADANDWCSKLLKECDSWSEFCLSRVGEEFPLTNDDKFFRDVTEIDVKEKLDSIAKEHVKSQRRKEQQDAHEVSTRTQELYRDTQKDREEAISDIDFYTTLQVKRATLMLRIDEYKKALRESENIVVNAETEIRKLDLSHPEYKKQYKSKYSEGLQKVGVEDPSENQIIKYFPNDNEEMAEYKKVYDKPAETEEVNEESKEQIIDENST